jgi:hypothetical protein
MSRASNHQKATEEPSTSGWTADVADKCFVKLLIQLTFLNHCGLASCPVMFAVMFVMT